MLCSRRYRNDEADKKGETRRSHHLLRLRLRSRDESRPGTVPNAGAGRRPGPTAASRARRAQCSACSWDTQLTERRSNVTANVTVPLEVCNIGHHLRPPDDMQERAIDDSCPHTSVRLLARDRPRRLSVAAGRASSTVVY